MSQLDYGLIGNCQISALVSRRGAIAWACLPRFDSPSVFASIIDQEQGGEWAIESAGPAGLVRQHYLRNTNVLVSVHSSADGQEEFEVVDFAPRFEGVDHCYRPPQIIRILRPLKGTPRVVVRCRPRPGYGKETPRAVPFSSGVVYEAVEGSFYLHTDAPISYVLEERPFELKEARHFALSYGAPFRGALRFEAEEQRDRTAAYWRSWVKQCNIPFEFQAEVIRSALTLKLHVFEDTGAIVAATTTSIPEGPEPGRTWDYRYCWLRDAYFVVGVLNRLGQFDEMEQFIRYLQNVASSEPSGLLQPVYGIGGEKELVEREIPWLRGFKGLGPVRVGNAAYAMEQHDVYGEMVLAIAPTFFDRRLDRTDLERALGNVRQLVAQALRCFEIPDAGIWEFRGRREHSVFSKLMNWAAVDRGVRIAARVGRDDLVNEWTPARERMRAEIERNAWCTERGYYAQRYGGNAPDAANLLLGAINFSSAGDERFRATVDAYERILRVGSGVYRYRDADDFGVPKTTFTVCGFWMADALWCVGRRKEARELFSAIIARANHVGLFSEDMDPETGELWGNFPQTYSHVGLINTAMKVSQSWDDAF